MIALVSEKACGHCPLSFHCLRGKPLVVGFTPAHGGTTRRPNMFDIAWCSRCYCVTFQLTGKRFLCARIRDGHHGAITTERPGEEAVLVSVGNRRHEAHLRYQGCGFEGWNTYPEDKRDCLTLYSKSIDEVF